MPRPTAPGHSLTQFILGSTILASHTIQGQDRIALGYVNEAFTNHFQLLLPLGFHSVDNIQAALNIFSHRSRAGNTKRYNFEVAIRESSRVFSASPRIAYCHLFFLSSVSPANRASNNQVPWIDKAIGFHTITPQSYCPINHMNRQPGWHIFYDLEEIGSERTHFAQRIAKALRHIRLGIRHGSLDHIKIGLTPGPGCQIEPVAKFYQITSLHPGEVWSLPIDVIIPVAFQETDREELQKLPQLAMETIVGINKFLMGWVRDLPEQILTVQVEYEHSLLPTICTVNHETYVTSLRSRRASHDKADLENPSTTFVQPGEKFTFSLA